ncbi:MAG: Crp/Fnr family transcriptional regulator [Bacteroidota bacterium]
MNLKLIRKEIEKVLPIVEDQFADFAKMLSVVRLDKGAHWEKEGKIAAHLGFVNTGILRKYVQKEGNEFIERFYVSGDFLGDYESFKFNSFSSSNVEVVAACELLTLPFERLDCLMGLSKNIDLLAQYVKHKKMQELNRRYTSLLRDSPEERYQGLLVKNPDLIKNVPQYYIAQYLGVTPETLSRIKKRVY